MVVRVRLEPEHELHVRAGRRRLGQQHLEGVAVVERELRLVGGRVDRGASGRLALLRHHATEDAKHGALLGADAVEHDRAVGRRRLALGRLDVEAVEAQPDAGDALTLSPGDVEGPAAELSRTIVGSGVRDDPPRRRDAPGRGADARVEGAGLAVVPGVADAHALLAAPVAAARRHLGAEGALRGVAAPPDLESRGAAVPRPVRDAVGLKCHEDVVVDDERHRRRVRARHAIFSPQELENGKRHRLRQRAKAWRRGGAVVDRHDVADALEAEPRDVEDDAAAARGDAPGTPRVGLVGVVRDLRLDDSALAGHVDHAYAVPAGDRARRDEAARRRRRGISTS